MSFVQDTHHLGSVSTALGRLTLVQKPTLRFLPGPKIFKGTLGQLISKRGVQWTITLLDCVQLQTLWYLEVIYWCLGWGWRSGGRFYKRV